MPGSGTDSVFRIRGSGINCRDVYHYPSVIYFISHFFSFFYSFPFFLTYSLYSLCLPLLFPYTLLRGPSPIQIDVWGARYELPQRVRIESGRQTVFAAFENHRVPGSIIDVNLHKFMGRTPVPPVLTVA